MKQSKRDATITAVPIGSLLDIGANDQAQATRPTTECRKDLGIGK